MTTAEVLTLDWCYSLECLKIQKHEGNSLHFLVALDNATCENTQTSFHNRNKFEIVPENGSQNSIHHLKTAHSDIRGGIFIPAGFTSSARIKMLYSEELSVLLSSLICSPAMDLCIPEWHDNLCQPEITS